jgi:hypothetical protein
LPTNAVLDSRPTAMLWGPQNTEFCGEAPCEARPCPLQLILGGTWSTQPPPSVTLP